MADGGGDLTVVVWLPLVVTVDVDSVTIGSAIACSATVSKTTIAPPASSDTTKYKILSTQDTVLIPKSEEGTNKTDNTAKCRCDGHASPKAAF